MKECYLLRHVVYLLPKGSPFTNQMNDLIFRLTDSGLLRKYFQDEMDKVNLVSSQRKRTAGVTLSLDDMQGVFMLYGLMAGAAILLFVFEHGVLRNFKRKEDQPKMILKNDQRYTDQRHGKRI